MLRLSFWERIHRSKLAANCVWWTVVAKRRRSVVYLTFGVAKTTKDGREATVLSKTVAGLAAAHRMASIYGVFMFLGAVGKVSFRINISGSNIPKIVQDAAPLVSFWCGKETARTGVCLTRLRDNVFMF